LVENTIRDHRLRVLFPTGADTSVYLAEQAFDVVERPIALRPDNARYKELEVETKPQQSWTAVHDDSRGLAVVSTGLPESAVRDLPDRPIALTLLRSFARTVMTSGEPGGQIQGEHAFDYRIVPLGGHPDRSRLSRLGQNLAAGQRVVQIEARDLAEESHDRPARRDLPLTHSFLKVESGAPIVTAVHRHSDQETGTIRMYNPKEESIEFHLNAPILPGTARSTDLEGKAGDRIDRNGDAVHVRLKPKQIATIRFEG
jgi:alpha-mannosidase/mannosylglycerate hydrolase